MGLLVTMVTAGVGMGAGKQGLCGVARPQTELGHKAGPEMGVFMEEHRCLGSQLPDTTHLLW